MPQLSESRINVRRVPCNPTAMPQKEETAVDTQRLTAHESFEAAIENAS